jgi:hypothetical protein
LLDFLPRLINDTSTLYYCHPRPLDHYCCEHHNPSRFVAKRIRVVLLDQISSKFMKVQDLGGPYVTHVTPSRKCLQACIFSAVKGLFGKISTSSTSAGLTLQSTFIDPSTPRPTTEQIRHFSTGFVKFCRAGSNNNHTLYIIITGRTKIRIGLRTKVVY